MLEIEIGYPHLCGKDAIVNKYALIAALLIGIPLGLGGFTFHYAAGTSYLSNDPKACVNCHVMRDQYEGWLKSSHHTVTCNDCHVPNDNIVRKFIAKGENGYHHSKGFTLEDFHEPIMIKAKNSQILQDNCLRCHGEFVHDIVTGSTTEKDAIRCVHCHKTVGHGG